MNNHIFGDELMIIIEQKNEWDYYLNTYFKEQKDVYNEYNYYKLYSDNFNINFEAIFWEDENLQLFWPHLIRDIKRVVFLNEDYYDLTSPYGYCGPHLNVLNARTGESLKKFSEIYRNYILNKKYLCEFIRFNPLLNNWEHLTDLMDLKYLNDIVVVDLTNSLYNIEKNINKGHRYNIKKTLRSNCNIEIFEKPCKEEIEEFITLYYATMKRNKAAPKYYFTNKFIKDHFNLLNTVLIRAKKNEETISSSIFLLGNKFLHYHLSGRTDNNKGLFPTDLIIWEAIKWGKNKNLQHLNLGGGINQNDTLFKYKKGFSNTVKKNYIGSKIFNLEKYNEISIMKKCESNKNTFFPAYRRDIDSIV